MNPSTGKTYGSASLGGANNYGVIFELDTGTPWTRTVLQTLSLLDGETPNGFLQLVRGHNVGSTANGGANLNGTVFSLTPPTSPGGWTEHLLHSFLGTVDGLFPRSVIADARGALYGSTNGGESGVGGTVWKLAPSAGSGPWMLTTLRAFTGGTDGGSPGNRSGK